MGVDCGAGGGRGGVHLDRPHAIDAVTELITHLRNEWAVLVSAPFSFVVTLMLAAGVAFAACRWGYSRIIDGLREQVASKNERLAAKDQQLDGYRERLDLIPATGSEIARESQINLQAEVLKFVGDLREWLGRRRAEDSQRQHQQWLAMTRTTDEVERKKLWDAHSADILTSSLSMNTEYDGKFKVRAILFRDELLTRLPQPADNQSRAFRMYEHPTNPIGMGMVADDLERMARSLRR
jgi:hypothetical protein